jgi:hypothetical protein
MIFSGIADHEVELPGQSPYMAIHQVGKDQESTIDTTQCGNGDRCRGHFFPLKMTLVNRSMNVSFGSMTSLS